ncbi:E3 ubiquitin-protein ligase synoviolin B-like [Mizuhopecten yessoensis]|uniref:RING-type E3 ubiquitin transferase n=1 Tax=Mizuhopecten yessoensis TaxID=6573 RepID=A0A210Q9S7_MIZYE|nr:E3 ubiquitin-protein ligase synoviolin B-like [Mizuhopecten yessoensis]OWF45465.1 E3 ubiquitin-protein ligase synoviolin B [Mizuhopecten yessoensis]
MKAVLLTGVSFVLTSIVVGNAYYQKKQFYPSVVYITKSNPSMAMLYIQAFVGVILMGKLMRKIFFGQLRAAEMEHLIERSWYAVTETCLAFTVFRDDFSPRFVALFTLLLFLKCFHWLAEDRVDYMERSPVISVKFHIRVLSLLGLLGMLDLYFINDAYYSTLTKGASVQLVFGFEYAVLLTVVWMTLMKYILHSIDLQNENPWENKAVYLLYTELIIGFIKVVLYIVFMAIMIKVHTFPLFAIRPMYLSLRGFKKALHDVIMSRRAIQNMNTLYPDATAEELQAGDNVCIICREDMLATCKKLPCNHIFHTSCLRSWFQRQQTCPTCRMDVLRMTRAEAAAPQQPPQQQQQPQPQQPQVPQMPQNLFQGFPGMPPMWPNMPQQPQAAPGTSGASSTTTSATAMPSSTAGTSTVGATSTQPTPTTTGTTTVPPIVPPMLPFMMPYGSYAMPRPPRNLAGVSAEELRAMEGQERENVEARLQWLQDIQALLDGAMVLINQYNTVATQTGIAGISAASFPLSQNKSDKKEEMKADSSQNSSQHTNTQGPGLQPTDKTDREDQKLDFSGLEGATGFSPAKEETIPAWEDPHEEEHNDEMHEVRKRRLQKFTQENPSGVKTEHKSQD